MEHQSQSPASQRSQTRDHGTPRLKYREKADAQWSILDSPDSSKLMNLRIDDGDDDAGDSGLEVYTDYGYWINDKMRREMDVEKKLYPGASTWASDEERLFEILYLRQELPILPSFWEIDFRGIPISERCFSTTKTSKPIIYAHCREFRATMALTRLIDLTANVRTVLQCGLPHKAPPMIKKALDSYISWAAQDGSFAHLNVVPNIIAEVIDSREGEANVTRIIENRMRALARLQREYLKIRRDVEFNAPCGHGGVDERKGRKTGGFRLLNVFFRLFETAGGEKVQGNDVGGRTVEDEDHEIGGDTLELLSHNTFTKPNIDQTNHHQPQVIKQEDDTDTPMSDFPPFSPSPNLNSQNQYRRRPPVVYGLFIVRTSILIMSVDSSRGESGYVSFHVEADLKDYRQSVWNALTMAMVVCIARDEMMSRLGDFEAAGTLEESDDDV